MRIMLFDVDWDLKTTEVKYGNVSEKKKTKKEKKKRKKLSDVDTESKGERIQPKAPISKEPQEQIQEAKEVEQVKEVKGVKKAAPIIEQSKNLTPLQQKMMAKLSGSRFRWINEQLYTISSESAVQLIKQQPNLFDEYHQGFRSQVQGWPQNPVNVFVDQIKTRFLTKNVNAPGGLPGNGKQVAIADMGCGEAQLALEVSKFSQKQAKRGKSIIVHSFDLKKVNDRITVADIKNVPLADNSCNIVIFCLALMGTNFIDFIQEANRILAPQGELWIAEIKSRFNEKEKDIGQEFIDAIKLQGFFHKTTDNENKMFSRFEFFKPAQKIIQERQDRLKRKKKFIEKEDELEKFNSKRQKHPEGEWLLKPCIYKRR